MELGATLEPTLRRINNNNSHRCEEIRDQREAGAALDLLATIALSSNFNVAGGPERESRWVHGGCPQHLR